MFYVCTSPDFTPSHATMYTMYPRHGDVLISSGLPRLSRALSVYPLCAARHAIQWVPNPLTLPTLPLRLPYSYQAKMLLVREMASPHMRAALRTLSLTRSRYRSRAR